jgi:hypothetical protein
MGDGAGEKFESEFRKGANNVFEVLQLVDFC